MAASVRESGIGTTPHRPTTIDPALACRAISGVTLEVDSLDAARTFYAPIFASWPGAWDGNQRAIRFRTGTQTIELVRRARPKTYPDSAYHCGYRVPSSRLAQIVDQLGNQGFPANWWHEDDPAERALSAYLDDPAGNRAQLLAARDQAPGLDHVALQQHDLEAAELFYTRALGGTLTFSHGWDARDQLGLDAWMAGDDPCAPFTRRISVSYRTKRPAPMPLAHIFVAFGATRLGLFLAPTHRQEPPPGVVRGTPRLILRTDCAADDLERHLRTVNVSPVTLKYDGGYVQFARVGDTFSLRDPGGHFVQVICRP